MTQTIKIILFTLLSAWVLVPSNILAGELLIKNITLVSPERDRPLNNAYVRIIDGEIKEIAQTSLSASINTQQIDGTGKFLIPGLTDSHIHTSTMPGLIYRDSMPEHLQKLQELFLIQQPRSLLYFGVTQIVDPSQSRQSIEKFNAAPEKPDLFHCGAVPILGGYPTVYVSESAAFENFEYLILQPTAENPLPVGIDPDLHTPEMVIEKIASDGAICVKVFIEDGFGSENSWPLINQHLLERVNKAAKKYGLIVMAHANAIDMQQLAQKMSVDVIAHGMWNWNHLDGRPDLPLEIRQTLDKIMKQKTVFQPTFGVMDALKGVTVRGVLKDPLYRKTIPHEIHDWYETKEGQWFKDEMIAEFDGLPLAKIHQRYDVVISQGERVVQYLDSKNYPLVLASDTPAAPTYAAQPGFTTLAEIKHLFKAGVSLERIFSAATINNAKAFRLDKNYGSIEPGKIANLLVLDQNPLETIDAYNSIRQVILKGKAIPRETLAANQQIQR